ncbi:MAG: glycosyltransferase family 39 protein [Candidatus Acidiferrales bacterium]
MQPMNSGAIEIQTDSATRVTASPPGRGAPSWASIVERWLNDHLNSVALLIVAAGFVIRLFVAGRSYLNPDEALDYLLINQPSAFLAYKASLTNAHPPLIYILIYFWHFLGRSELMLRLPSVLAGTAFCWVIFKWIKIVFGEAASLIGVIFAAFSPALIALSAELRQYAVLLFCMAAALYFLERAFEEVSAVRMWCFSVFLYLAILTHYSAVFFVAAIGIYALARIVEDRFPRNISLAWVIGQIGALAIYGFLYVTHVSKITKNSMALWEKPLDDAYFHAGRESLLAFTWDRTLDIFYFLYGLKSVALAMVLIFAVGVAVLFFRDIAAHDPKGRSQHLGILVLLPFAAVWAAAIAGIYPYAGTRHTVFLAPFAIAAVSFLLAAVYQQKLWAGLLIAALIMGASSTSTQTFEPFIKKENQSRALMTGAMNYIHQSIPQDEIILTDYQSSLPLAYYLCGPKRAAQSEQPQGEFTTFNCDGYSVVSTTYNIYKLTPRNFAAEFEAMAHAHGLKPGDRVWVFQNGWGANLDTQLPWRFPKFQCLTPKSFGANLTMIPFLVGPDWLPAAPAIKCAAPAFNSLIS